MVSRVEHAFECCLHDSIKDLNKVETFDQLYNSTIHCNVHLNATVLKEEYLARTIFTFMGNDSYECYDPVCMEKTTGWFNVYVVYWILALIIGFVGNLLVIIAFGQTKSLRKSVTNFFVTSLAASDLLVIMFIIPIKIHQALHNDKFCAPLIACRLYYTTDLTFFVASILNLFAVTCDRFIAITMPYRYQNIMKPLHAQIIILLVWIYAFIWGLMINFNTESWNFDAVFVQQDECIVHNKFVFFVICYVLVFFIPSLIMLVLYIVILRISILHAKHIDETRFPRRGSNDSNRRFQNSARFFSARKLEFRAAKLVCIVYGTFIICWLPVTVLFFAYIKGPRPPLIVRIIFADILPLANSITNPFIYGVLHRDFKKSLKRLLGISVIAQKRKFRNRKRSANDSSRFSNTHFSYVSSKSYNDSPTSRRTSTLDTPRINETLEESISPRSLENFNNNNPSNYIDCRKSSSSDESNKSLSSEEAVKFNDERKPLMNAHIFVE